MSFFTKFFSEHRRNKQQKYYEQKHSDALRKAYLLDTETPFAITKAFRNLKASLSVAIPKKEEGGISILSTSTFPEEGKTTITVNLAQMFATSNFKVVLIDADIRKGRVSKYFKDPHEPGLSDYLSGQAKLEEVLHQSKQNKNLYVIYQGTQSPRPYELLESDAMKALSEELKKQFDYIIYDTPPVELVSDALALVPITDGALLVCRYMRSYESDIKSSLDTLRFAKANVLGMVVNDFHVNPKKLKKNQQKYYYSYYSYGYGEADPEKDSKITKKVPPPAVFLNK